jgi:ABC-type branched-subunit amino acid transport system substrate-binding protein
MKHRKWVGLALLVLLILVLMPLLSACSPTPPATNELEVGVILALSGPFSGPLQLLKGGIVACADWINDNGGLSVQGENYTIELIFEDNQLTPEGATAAANKLAYDDQVEFIVGPIIPFLSAVVAPITEEAEVLRCQIDGVGFPGELSSNMTYTFSTFFSRGAVEPTFDYFVDTYPGLDRVALTCPADPGSEFNMALGKDVAEGLGLNVTYSESYPSDTVDFYPLMTTILGTNPDAVCMGEGMTAQYAGIVKAARDLGFNSTLFCYSSTGDIEEFTLMIGTPYAYDIFTCDEYLESAEMPDMVREVEALLADNYGAVLTANHVYGWDALWYVAQAIEEADSIDPLEVAATWETMESLDSMFGPVTMGGQETFGINHVVGKISSITRLEDGAIEFVKWFDMEAP